MDSRAHLVAARLESERLALEPLRASDADELAPLLDDISLHEFTGGSPASVGELRARFAQQARGLSPDGRDVWLNWVVRERAAGGRAVGTVQATVRGGGVPDAAPGLAADLAWVIGSAYQGQGYATEAAAAMAEWLRSRGVTRLGASIHPRHEASMAVARSLGLSMSDELAGVERRWETPSG